MPSVSGQIVQDEIANVPKLGSNPVIDNLTLTLANTEYSLALTTDTRRFIVTTRQGNEVKLAYTLGQSSTIYLTIPAGGQYQELFIGDGTLTLYLQGQKAGTIVEVIHWYQFQENDHGFA